MKSIAFISILAVGSSLAGETPPVFDESPLIPPAPSLYQWFAGATAGYLIDHEEDMYTLHIGTDLPNQIGGWDQALYLEVGYTEFDDCRTFSRIFTPRGSGTAAPGSSPSEEFYKACADLEIIPVTLNYKLEKQVSNSLNWYVGVGLGVAFLDVNLTTYSDDDTESGSDDDTVFYAQAFTGLIYNVSPSWELYGGVRYIYFDEPSFRDGGDSADWSELESHLGWDNTDFLVELGTRFNF